MYTTHDVSSIGPTLSSDDRISLYCQIRFERTRSHTGNKEGTLATVTINWQQEGYADKEGHIGNNNGTMAKRRAHWQQDGYTDIGVGAFWQQEGYTDMEGHIDNNNGTLAKRRAYWQQWHTDNK
jgi:hypothetical protein